MAASSAEMQDTFKERYKFDDWKTIFNQVFEASHEGTTVKVVRAAMTEHGVLNPLSNLPVGVADLSSQSSSSDNVLHTLPSTQASSSQTCKVSCRSNSSLSLAKHSRLDKSIAQFLDVSALEDDKDEDDNEDIDDLAIGVDCCSRVTEVGPSGQATFNQCLQDLAHHYKCEGSITRSNAQACQCNLKVGMHVDAGQSESKVFMIELPTACAAGFVLEHLKLKNLACQTFPSLPKHIFVKALNPLQVQVHLPPSHTTLIKEIVLIPTEQMQSIPQPYHIPIHSWVCNLTGPFKNDIAYILSTEGDVVKMLVVPWVVPYHSTCQNSFHGHTLFDVYLARAHGLEVMVSADEEGHLFTYCEGKEYHWSCIHLYSPKNKVKVVSMPLPNKIAWFALASIDPPLVNCTLARFSAQWWQDGDTGRICSGEFTGKLACIVMMDSQYESVTVCVSTPESSDALVKDLEISIHNFKLEFHPSTSVKVIASMNCGFEGMVIGKLEIPENIPGIACLPDSLLYDPLANESHIQLGDFIQVLSRPHKGLSGTLHYCSGHEILVTPSTLPQKGTNNPSDKGKSKADDSETTGGNNDIDEGSNLVQVPVSMDDAIILPLSTLQFSKERGCP
ncbi:hypothetical protein BKA83DRAFT_4125843 [Pisolithus microcarpus]|nr:hypothetical protein BKA83DRAFT_4125843 [Pisolithus microcarpus]